MSCCDDVKTKLEDFGKFIQDLDSKLLTASQERQQIIGRVKLIEDTLQEIINAVKEIVPFNQQDTPILKYLETVMEGNDEFRKDLLEAVSKSLIELGKDARQKFIRILGDALAVWFLSILTTATDAVPKEVGIDPDGGGGESTRQFFTVLVFPGSEGFKESLNSVSQTLDGGSSEGSAVAQGYQQGIFQAGRGLGSLVSQVASSMSEGVASAAKTGKIIAAVEPPKEKDPVWGDMRKQIFGLSDVPPDVSPDELTEVEQLSSTQEEK
jgi:hypothetical protein